MLVKDPLVPGGLRTKLLDFGIAKLAEENSAPGQQRTRTGALMGTPAYMSPEQCRGAGQVADKSDVYSLGVMLYQMVAGTRPFDGTGDGELIAKHLFFPLRLLQEVDPTIDNEAAALIHKTLSKEPAERPTMAEVAEALQRMEQSRPKSAPASEPTQDWPQEPAQPAPKPVEGPKQEAAQESVQRLVPAVARDGDRRNLRRRWPWLIGGGLLLSAALTSAIVATRNRQEHPAATLTGMTVPPPASTALTAPASVAGSQSGLLGPAQPAGADNREAAAPGDGLKRRRGSPHAQDRDERHHGYVGKTKTPAESPAPGPATSEPAGLAAAPPAPAMPERPAPAPTPAPPTPDPQSKATLDEAKLEYAFGHYKKALTLARSVRQDKAAGRVIAAAACRLGELSQASETYAAAGAADRTFIETECTKAGAQLVGERFVGASEPQK
jgi:hypothetical protein